MMMTAVFRLLSPFVNIRVHSRLKFLYP